MRKFGYHNTGFNWKNLDIKAGSTLDETMKMPQASQSPRMKKKNEVKVKQPPPT